MSLSPSASRVGHYCIWALVGAATVGLVGHAHAGGFEDTVTGAEGLGRAASFGRVHDFMATWQNPANLAVVPGADLGLELRLTLFDACFDRQRDPTVEYRVPGEYLGDKFEGSETFQNVCNEAPLGPSGNIGWAQSFPSGWGFGVGLFTPAGVGSEKFGTNTVVTWPPYNNDEQYPITRQGEESPTRQMLIQEDTVGAWLGAGAGVQLIPQLRVGLGLAAGITHLRSSSVTSAVGGTFRDQEYLTEVSATDWFVPRAVLSVVGTPLPALDVYGIVVWQDDIKATGDVTFTSNGIQDAPLLNCRDTRPGTHCGVQDARVNAPLPNFDVTVGARYAQRRTTARPAVLDPMRDERWDVEFNAGWTATSHVKEFRVDLYEGDPGPTPPSLQTNSGPMSSASPLARTSAVPKRWKDTLSLRIGGDFNVVPSRLALRAGLSYASSAVPLEYMNIDAWPVRKIGLHLGATVSFGKTKLSVGYAHLFYESVRVPLGYGAVKDVVQALPELAQAVNEGDYRASQDVLSVQANYAF